MSTLYELASKGESEKKTFAVLRSIMEARRYWDQVGQTVDNELDAARLREAALREGGIVIIVEMLDPYSAYDRASSQLERQRQKSNQKIPGG